MSQIPSSEVDLDSYCHKLYQEKVRLTSALCHGLCLTSRINCYVNIIQKGDSVVKNMNGKEGYDGR